MKPGCRLALLLGCVFVAALVSPHTARVAGEDWFGPYALRFEVLDADFAAAPAAFDGPHHSEEFDRDADRYVDLEAAHDAP